MRSKRNVAVATIGTLALVLAMSGVWACSEEVESTTEPTIRPNLPTVPTVPPPPHPITYPDGTYSVYGLRKRIEHTIDTNVRVTGYIVEIYQRPECPQGETCPPNSKKMPHLWISDTANEQDHTKRLTLVGYAASQDEIDEAREQAQRGGAPRPPEGEGLPPIPTDFEIGRRGVFEGRFSRMSGAGFLESEGLLDYRSHVLEGSPEGAPTGAR